MSRKSAHLGWPSVGFYMLLSVHSLLFGLLWWGWQKPPLDDAFEILARRELDDPGEFTQKDVRLLQQVWDSHPAFGRALAGKSGVKFVEPTESGWLSRGKVHLAIRPETEGPTSIRFEARGEASDFPMTIGLKGATWQRQVQLSAGQPQTIEFGPSDLPRPSIFDVEIIAGTGRHTATPTWALHVSSGANNARENP